MEPSGNNMRIRFVFNNSNTLGPTSRLSFNTQKRTNFAQRMNARARMFLRQRQQTHKSYRTIVDEKEKSMPLTCGPRLKRTYFIECNVYLYRNRFRVVIFVLVAWTRAHYTRFRFGLCSIVQKAMFLPQLRFVVIGIFACVQRSLLIFNRFSHPHTSHTLIWDQFDSHILPSYNYIVYWLVVYWPCSFCYS